MAPLLGDIPHSAALLGDGSEVLGFDDAVSTDHDFGPRLQVFVSTEADAVRAEAALEGLPDSFDGFPVVFRDTDRFGGRAHHQVEVTTAPEFFTARLGTDPAAGMQVVDWLTTPTQRLATLTAGEVFHDPDGSLTTRRAALTWYPDDVWRYALAAAWLRVSQEGAFVGRTGGLGDELGSLLLTARVARDLIRIAFLVERRWAPYHKWLGTAFTRLPVAGQVGPHVRTALHAGHWRDREAALCAGQRELATATNHLGLAEQVDPEPRQYHDRDIRVLAADRLTAALIAPITDPYLRALLTRLGHRHTTPMLPGTIDQAVDSVDILTHPDRCRNASAALGLPSERPG
ncbi:MAG TPA: DUF4037 domain-containing protein [Mycobacteriales bacterium]|nr:DUF4037 domain-containing protein [Mycobacteriales bacterium]